MMANGTNGQDSLGQLLQSAMPLMRQAGIHATGDVMPGEVSVGDLRRRRLRRGDDEEAMYLTLLRDENGVLLWHADGGPSSFTPARTGGRARRAGVRAREDAPVGEVVDEFKYRPLKGSQVGALLDKLDNGFNGFRGLRALTPGGWSTTDAVPVAKGRILLIVHGTFSNAEAIRVGLDATPDGKKFLRDCLARYDQVLAFEHPTLSVSPFLNGFDLARLFASTAAAIDVVCHSRGGLVVRWWLEALNGNPRINARVVFVGSPLGGTSLASPEKLRHALNFLTNIVDATRGAVDMAALAVPLLGVISGLMRLVGSATRVVGSTPVVDAAIAMIPGLAAQSRIDNNFERLRLRSALAAVPKTYNAILSNFEPTAPGWKFWEYFVRPGQRVADAGADMIFDDANDLVVDTASMTELSSGLAIAAKDCIFDFGTNPTVHHLNYFSQPQTVAFLAARFS